MAQTAAAKMHPDPAERVLVEHQVDVVITGSDRAERLELNSWSKTVSVSGLNSAGQEQIESQNEVAGYLKI